jgi:hypothetical protein
LLPYIPTCQYENCHKARTLELFPGVYKHFRPGTYAPINLQIRPYPGTEITLEEKM